MLKIKHISYFEYISLQMCVCVCEYKYILEHRMISAKPKIDFHIVLATLQGVHATTFFRKGLDGNGSALHPPKRPKQASTCFPK